MKFKHLFVLVLPFCIIPWNNVFALSVSPAIIELAGDPGSVLSGSLTIVNTKENAQDLFVSYENFEPSEDAGTPRFIGGETGLATWISSETSFSIISGEAKNLPFTIRIPSDAQPGGYFAAIFTGNQPPSLGGGEVSIGGRLGVLILLRVEGDIDEAGGISKFKTTHRWYAQQPVEFSYTFTNDGGDRVVPRGVIYVKNIFSFKKHEVIANQQEGNVLPQSARTFTTVWGEKDQEKTSKGFFSQALTQLKDFKLGLYTATLNISWGKEIHTQKVSHKFVIFPLQLMVMVILIIAGLFFLLRYMMQQYKKRLLAEFKKHNLEH